MAIDPVKKVQVGMLLFDKAPTVVLIKYFDYISVFLAENTIELPKYTKINNYIIKLKKVNRHFLA